MDRLDLFGFPVIVGIVTVASSVRVKPSGNRMELAHRSFQPSSGHLLEVAAEMGLVVCSGAGSVGVRDDPLSAPPHRSGVSGAGSGFCFDVCANWLSVAGVAARHCASWFRFW